MSKASHPFYTRYGRKDIPLPLAPVNSFVSGLLTRVSCRHFLPTPPPNGTLELLVGAAQSAPTSGMLQTWSVISLNAEDKAKLFSTDLNKKILGGVDSHNFAAIETSQIFLIWLADLNRTNFILQNTSAKPEIRLQVNKAEFNLKAIIDASIAAQTLFMTAESMGLAGTYMGAIRQLPATFLRDAFNLPLYTMPLFATAHGYPDEAYQAKVLNGIASREPKARLGQELILHHSTYKPMHSLEQLREYNKVHQTVTRREVSTFESRVIERLEPSQGKGQTGDFLKQMGFNFE